MGKPVPPDQWTRKSDKEKKAARDAERARKASIRDTQGALPIRVLTPQEQRAEREYQEWKRDQLW